MGFFKITFWAIIFITRLRFPPGISIAEILTKFRSVVSYSQFRVQWHIGPAVRCVDSGVARKAGGGLKDD